jgi:hypothetical protein
LCTLFSNFVYSQQSLTQINGWNAYVHLPAGYSSTSASYPTIIFFPGLGEVGTNANALISNGPGAYIAQGWNGNVVVNGSTIEFIVISIQPPSAYPGETVINDKIQKIKSLYRVDDNRLYLTGLSHGGWCSTTFVTGDAYGGPYNYASQIAAVVEVEGVIPDDNAPYPNLFDNFANSGGRLLGFEQIYDNRGMPTRINRMNATKPNSGIYVQTNFGGGGHCCWNQFYGGQGVQPGNFMLDGVSQNLYQWLARQSRTGVAPPPANQTPTANAGTDKTITLPTSSVTLSGSGSDPDGSISSYSWTKVSGNGGTIASANSATTNITGLTQGSYTFQLKVTDNTGATATDNVVVTVNAAAVTLLPAVNPANTVSGLDYKYYEGSWSVLPAFASLTSVKTGSVNNFDISVANRTDQMGFSFSGFINVPADGEYTFYTTSDDGSKLLIDNVTVVNNDGLHGSQERSGIIGLKAGKHAIEGLFFEQNGGEIFSVSYSSNSIAKQTIPSSSFFRIAISNQAPTANAGADKIITLPVSSVALTGSGTDTDGSIASFQWTKISGSGGTIVSANSASTNITGLTQGNYTFQLKVTDNAGATATDNIAVTVNAATAQAPPPPVGCNTNAPVTHLLTQTGPGEIYRPNGSTWKGGDTVKITGTSYSVIEFNNVAGDPCRPIVIMPLTTVTTPVFRIKGNSRYLKIWGGKTQYGLKVNGGPVAITTAHHIEVDNVEATGGSTGVYCKQDVVYSDPMTWDPNYRMTKFTFKNMWIHDINGEGMYVGITQPSGLTVTSTWSGLDTVIVPIRLDSVEISNNIVERCSWDAIQLSNARYGNKIFGNIVRDYGTINMSSQQAGIILGGNTNGDIYNNTITRGTGNGIEAFGFGVINIYGNTLDSCGYDGRTNANGTQGQQPIYASDFLNGVEVNPKQTINVYNNAVNHPLNSGGIIITGYYNNSFPSSAYGNTFCIPNAPANWQNTYLKLYVAGSSNSNNILSCSVSTPPVNVAPTANAGADQVIALPTSIVTLNGSGNDPDGSVTSYSWRKISGSTAVIGSVTNAITAITGLLQGVYTFELTVTDNGGLTAKDTVQVTINPSGVTLLPAVNPSNTVNGLDYKYYEGSWSVLPAFNSLTAVKTGTVNNFDITVGNRADQIGFSFTGFITVPADGVYTFYTTSDDGSKLLIDNVEVVDNDGLHGSQERSGTIGLKAGKHAINGLFFEQGGGEVFTVSYEGAGVTKQQIPSSALYRVSIANNAPVANAGAGQNITTTSVTLSGTGTDSDGTIAAYNWTKVSGPDGISFSNANAASTTVTGLIQGVYLFQLKVTDNAGATATATTQVVVTLAASAGKAIRVNLFGGSNPFTDTKWNNWNIAGGMNSANFLYEDRTTSTVKASLAGDVMVVDNGTGYAANATMPAPTVLRYNSASTSQRDLTIKGLNPSKKYTLEFYASRKSTGNKTLFVIGNRQDTINTDNNATDYALFTDLVSNSSGSITVNISRIGVWNYISGFSIVEQDGVSARTGEVLTETTPPALTKEVYQGETLVEMGANSVSVYPNPFAGAFKVQLNNKTAGEFVLKLTSQTGQTVFYKKVNKPAAPFIETINVSNMARGTYVLQIISVATGNQTVHKVIKN